MAVIENLGIADPHALARSAARRERLVSTIVPIGTAVALVGLWQLGVRAFGVPTYIAPAPSDVAVTLVEKYPLLMQNFWPTFFESVAGFVVGNLAAILIAVAFVHSRNVERAFFPIAVFVNTIPILAIAPILVLIFGPGMTAKVVIAALICFFPTLVNMTRGLRDVNPQQLELMHVLSASPREVFLKVRLKNSLPYLFSALKIAASTAVIGAIVGEWIGSTVGIGALIIQATYAFDSPLLYATIVVGSVFSATFFGVISWIEGRVLTWNVART